jgi:hypothetical protein
VRLSPETAIRLRLLAAVLAVCAAAGAIVVVIRLVQSAI